MAFKTLNCQRLAFLEELLVYKQNYIDTEITVWQNNGKVCSINTVIVPTANNSHLLLTNLFSIYCLQTLPTDARSEWLKVVDIHLKCTDTQTTKNVRPNKKGCKKSVLIRQLRKLDKAQLFNNLVKLNNHFITLKIGRIEGGRSRTNMTSSAE